MSGGLLINQDQLFNGLSCMDPCQSPRIFSPWFLALLYFLFIQWSVIAVSSPFLNNNTPFYVVYFWDWDWVHRQATFSATYSSALAVRGSNSQTIPPPLPLKPCMQFTWWRYFVYCLRLTVVKDWSDTWLVPSFCFNATRQLFLTCESRPSVEMGNPHLLFIRLAARKLQVFRFSTWVDCVSFLSD